jgi:hypothetical protein
MSLVTAVHDPADVPLNHRHRLFDCWEWACPSCGLRVHTATPGVRVGSVKVEPRRGRTLERCRCSGDPLVFVGHHWHLRAGE